MDSLINSYLRIVVFPCLILWVFYRLKTWLSSTTLCINKHLDYCWGFHQRHQCQDTQAGPHHSHLHHPQGESWVCDNGSFVSSWHSPPVVVQPLQCISMHNCTRPYWTALQLEKITSLQQKYLCAVKIPHSCTLHNINEYYMHYSLGWTEGWHPVEWRDIKTAGEVLPNPLSGQTTHKKLPLVQKVQLKQDSRC